MPHPTYTKLLAARDALDRKIEAHKPLPRDAAIKKLRAYAIEYEMTEDDLFPIPGEVDDPCSAGWDGEEPDFSVPDFSEFEYPNTLGYTLLEEMQQQRNEIDSQLRAVRREAIMWAQLFISEYDLAEEDIYPPPRRAK